MIKVLRARLMRGKPMYWSANDLIYFSFIILVGVQLLYNVVFVSPVQKSVQHYSNPFYVAINCGKF